MVPHVARHGTHQRLLKFQSITPKILLQQNLPTTDSGAPAIRSLSSLGHDSFRIVVGKKCRHVELASLQIISAAPVVHHAGLNGFAALNVGFPPQSDQKIAVRRPIHAERAIVLFNSLQQTRVYVIPSPLLALSPIRTSLHLGPPPAA